MDDVANVLRRLEILRGKLESDGLYVSANTVAMAEELITKLAEDRHPGRG
jgi:hypothetical protein